MWYIFIILKNCLQLWYSVDIFKQIISTIDSFRKIEKYDRRKVYSLLQNNLRAQTSFAYDDVTGVCDVTALCLM